MVTYLDCIERIGKTANDIIDKREKVFADLKNKLKERKINQIILIGSGSSYNAIYTTKAFIEKVTKIQTILYLPNDFLNNTFVLNKDAMYIFVSQTGTSTLTLNAIDVVKSKEFLTVGVTAFKDTPVAKKVDSFVDQGCGSEEYPMVTIGFNACVLTLMLMGLEIGKEIGSLDQAEYDKYLASARKLPTNYQNIIDKTNSWFDKNKEKLLKSKVFTFYAGNNLVGIAREAALKLMEVSKMCLASAWEIDDGMHGPTMGFQHENCVVALNDGGANNDKFINLEKWSKGELNNGFMVGLNPIDDTDLSFDTVCEDFNVIEYSGCIQTIACRLAEDIGVVIGDLSRHKENLYFNTHNNDLVKEYMDKQ